MFDLATTKCPATIPVVALLILVSASSCADSSPSRSDSQPAGCVRSGVEYPSGPGYSVPMGDGCNRCVCEDGEITSCTTLICTGDGGASLGGDGGASLGGGGANLGGDGGAAGTTSGEHVWFDTSVELVVIEVLRIFSPANRVEESCRRYSRESLAAAQLEALAAAQLVDDTDSEWIMEYCGVRSVVVVDSDGSQATHLVHGGNCSYVPVVRRALPSDFLLILSGTEGVACPACGTDTEPAALVCGGDGYCGDGVWVSARGEECDDGNTVGGDGCDEACSEEGS